MIVDNADKEMELAKDPWMEAGIAIPSELPYQNEGQREESARKVAGENEDSNLRDKLRKMSNVIQVRKGSVKFGQERKRLASEGESSLRSEFASIPGVNGVMTTTNRETTPKVNKNNQMLIAL